MQVFAHHDQLELRSGDLMVHYSGFILKLFQSSFVMFLFWSVLAKVKDIIDFIIVGKDFCVWGIHEHLDILDWGKEDFAAAV